MTGDVGRPESKGHLTDYNHGRDASVAVAQLGRGHGIAVVRQDKKVGRIRTK